MLQRELREEIARQRARNDYTSVYCEYGVYILLGTALSLFVIYCFAIRDSHNSTSYYYGTAISITTVAALLLLRFRQAPKPKPRKDPARADTVRSDLPLSRESKFNGEAAKVPSNSTPSSSRLGADGPYTANRTSGSSSIQSGRQVIAADSAGTSWQNAKTLIDFSPNSSSQRNFQSHSSPNGRNSLKSTRYYASPPHSSSSTAFNSPGASRAIVYDALECLKMDYLDDQWIINLRSMLGTYLSESFKRFTDVVGKITSILISSNSHLSEAQRKAIPLFLLFSKDRSLQSADLKLTQSDVETFCNANSGAGGILIVDIHGTKINLWNEYKTLLDLFKVAGETYHEQKETPVISISATPQEPPKVTGFFAAFSKPVVAKPAASSAQHGFKSVNSDEAKHCISSMIYRVKELSKDSDLSGYLWPAGGREVQNRLFVDISDPEIVMSIFLHFCDESENNISALGSSEGHRFSNFRFFNSTVGSEDFEVISGVNKFPEDKGRICIVRKRFSPPHFNVVEFNKNASRPHEKLVEYSIRDGRWNCFEAILIFLMLLVDRELSKLPRRNIERVMKKIFGSEYALPYD